ncbi:MAG: alpha/beta fold hydrolase [SAR202 cluster bacterium]|nr:alpha/beta fold hydrolase [SAR202 cluster bacterium]
MATLQEIQKVTDENSGKHVTVEGLKIHYNDIGTGDPIICIHGGGPGASGWSNFRTNLQDLALNHRVLLFDMPGWGRSEFNGSTEPWHDFISRMIGGFMDALNIKSAYFIGNSMGGQAVIKLAINHPERVKHLVMIGSQPTRTITVQAEPLDGLDNIVKFYRGGPSKEKMRRLVESLVHDSSWLTDDVVEERFKVATTPEALRQAELRTKQPRHDLYFEIEKITVPTLLVWGINDKGGALEVGLLMLRRMKNARMYIFQNCGHWAQVEKREEFDRVVLDFFKH